MAGFDTWEPVQCNSRLHSVLETFSASVPPPSNGPGRWTLDALFALPRSRIKYYQKLYGRLLKSSPPGKSTDKLLVEAVGKLEQLMRLADERSTIALPNPAAAIETTDEVVVDLRGASSDASAETVKYQDVEKPGSVVSEMDRTRSEEAVRPQVEQVFRTSTGSSVRGSSLSSG